MWPTSSPYIPGFIYVTDGRQRIPCNWLVWVPPMSLRGGTIRHKMHWAKSCLSIFERCWEDQLSTNFQNFWKMNFQIWLKMLEDYLSTSFCLSEDELLYFSNILKDELTNLLKYVKSSSSNNFLFFERQTSLSFKCFEFWTFEFSKRCRKLIYRRLSTFRKTDFSIFRKLLKIQLSNFQKDVKNSYIDDFQIFVRRISYLSKVLKFTNFRLFKKMSKTHISTSFKFLKDMAPKRIFATQSRNEHFRGSREFCLTYF